MVLEEGRERVSKRLRYSLGEKCRKGEEIQVGKKMREREREKARMRMERKGEEDRAIKDWGQMHLRLQLDWLTNHPLVLLFRRQKILLGKK